MTDRYDASRVWGLQDPASGLFADNWTALAPFNAVGVLAPADVHVAARLARLGGDPDPAVALAVALAVRAPRVGHVSVDLTRVRDVAASEIDDETDLDTLPWPEPTRWLASVAASPLVSEGEPPLASDPYAEAGAGARPLRLVGTALYLDRYWRDERVVAAELIARALPGAPVAPHAPLDLRGGAEELLAGDPDQRRALLQARDASLTVLVGGPGTGKTTTVARLLALLHHEARCDGRRPPLVALAAPTGKAAARLEEAVRAEADRLPVGAEVRDQLSVTPGVTLHRLLGTRPGGGSRFRHHRGNRLPHDTVVVDEASMVSLGMMARLLEAVRPDARLVLVGDADQLVSVEAGAVLADVVGPDPGAAGPALRTWAPAGSAPARPGRAGAQAPPLSPIAATVAVLRTNHRSAGRLAELAAAVRAGEEDRAVELLAAGGGVSWLAADPAGAGEAQLDALRGPILDWAAPMVRSARVGDAAGASGALGRGRVLCAHRRGPAGVAAWNERVEGWVLGAVPEVASDGPWYAGRPVLVTANDYSLRVFNGDVGVVVTGGGDPGERVVAFDGRADPVRPGRLAGVETVYAMTVHKAQGSELDWVAMVLPPPSSRLLTRELLYTAVTRARQRLLVVGEEASVRAAIGRRIARASGLANRLWGAARADGATGT